MDGWRRAGSERLQRCRVFDLDRVQFQPADGAPAHEYFVLQAPDWINVIALTGDRRVILVRQYRFGVEQLSLEIPGGMCDPGEAPADAARRELVEETGFEAAELRLLGSVHPNPAIQNNRCHSFLATGVRSIGPPRPEPGERLEVMAVPLDEIPARILAGEITHSLVIAAFHLLGLRSRF